MALHVTTLDASRHQGFLKQQRKDPVTKELLKPGDRVVICAGPAGGPPCGVAFLEGSWRAVGQRHGAHTETLPDIEVEAGPTRFGRHQAAPAPGRRITPDGTAAPPEANARATEGASREPATPPAGVTPATDATRPAQRPLRLREIPFQLREVPFGLRQISEL